MLISSVADPEGVQWVPWNPSLEGLPSKILCANRYSHWSYALELHSSNNARPQLNNFLYRRALDLHARIYYQKRMATIETMSKARERIKAKVFLFMQCTLCS